MNGVVEDVVGAPATFEELKHRPGRRLTLRASGPKGSAIVTLYGPGGAVTAAARIAALAPGPPELEVPVVLAVDPDQRLLVLSDISGIPLREAVLASDEPGCRRAGAALAAWHRAWAGKEHSIQRPHTIEHELELLADEAASAGRELADHVAAAVTDLRAGWTPSTVVHRDLSEEHLLLGARVGLIDLDDAALGPPELDVGNLLAHLDLLELRSDRDVTGPRDALLAGYATIGSLDPGLLERCRVLARLRLACIHDDDRLLAPTHGEALAEV